MTPDHSRPAPIPIVALDVPGAPEALALVERLPRVEWVKVGLQLFAAAGPDIVLALRERGLHLFLDLKFHDIPNTVARAVESATRLGVDLLTLHASGGREMMRAARDAAGPQGSGPGLLAVTVLTSLSGPQLAEAWGREAVSAEREVVRLATLARDSGMDGVVASVLELPAIREHAPELSVLTPGIRFAGDDAGDQTRVATPARAAQLGADYLVIGRSVTAAPDPAAAFERVLAELDEAPR
jgi:orotidine-5'-phosphate decarboxylase